MNGTKSKVSFVCAFVIEWRGFRLHRWIQLAVISKRIFVATLSFATTLVCRRRDIEIIISVVVIVAIVIIVIISWIVIIVVSLASA